MLREKLLFTVIQSLKILDAKLLGEIYYKQGLYNSVHSGRTNAQKHLNRLHSEGKLERIGKYYRVKGCRSEGGDHSLKLSEALTEILKITGIQPVIFRETKTPLNLIPDAMVLLIKDGKGLSFILEVANEETDNYLQSKVNDWRAWRAAKEYLSDLFKYQIPHFDIVVKGDYVPDGCYPFASYLKEVICGMV
ncbi:MAG: hypothetical protein C4581_06620 [Nitrospiraceae bacterium]|nr:MAG: hypothetical protein C4581_06620 [Nitrospiraceae bacterium]